MSLAAIKERFRRAGCTQLYAKRMAENDNSKNQVYFGPDFQAINLFPNTGIQPDGRPGNPTFKAKVRFGWLLDNGTVANAPFAQMILYPQYPEIRFSGFLRGCDHPPSELMAGRLPGRVLFLGVMPRQGMVGFVVAGDSSVAKEFGAQHGAPTAGVFIEVAIADGVDETTSRARLLSELKRINAQQWITSKQLRQDGTLSPCNAPQCGGFTLEAELQIPKNSTAEPDFLGWEVKQYAVAGFDRPASAKAITLMTPEPTGGVYRDGGPEAFVRRFGYPDQRGREDRLNFGGRFKSGKREVRTGLTLTLSGYDSAKQTIVDATGSLALVNDDGVVAASWGFAGLLAHWSRKHSKAVYVPSMCRTTLAREYSYGHIVRLAEGTDSFRLLKALAAGDVYYDPGIKLERASTAPAVKRRSQFRIASKNIPELYERVQEINVRMIG